MAVSTAAQTAVQTESRPDRRFDRRLDSRLDGRLDGCLDGRRGGPSRQLSQRILCAILEARADPCNGRSQRLAKIRSPGRAVPTSPRDLQQRGKSYRLRVAASCAGWS